MGICNITAHGHLGKDAELKFTPQGESILRFSVAVTHQEKEKSTTWFDCSLWGKRAEKLAQWLTKGKAVIVSGSFKLREWEKDGRKGKSAEIRVNEIDFSGSKQERQEDASHEADSRPRETQAELASEGAQPDDGNVPF